MSKPNYEALSVVKASRHRTRVIEELADGPKIPSEMSDDENQISRTSEALSDLEEQGLVELIVDENTVRGRLYALTEDGEEILEMLS